MSDCNRRRYGLDRLDQIQEEVDEIEALNNFFSPDFIDKKIS